MKTWRLDKKKIKSKTVLPKATKEKVDIFAGELIENKLKGLYIEKKRGRPKFNYIVDIYGKWYRNYYYFCAKYKCPSNDSTVPFFESKFARMEYQANKKFNLSFMRHNNTWWETEI